MKHFIHKFVLSGFSVALATLAVSPAAQAAEAKIGASFSVHQVRVAEFDGRNKNFDKSFEVSEDFDMQALRIAQRDRRNKAGDSLSTTSLMEQRQQVLDRRGYK